MTDTTFEAAHPRIGDGTFTGKPDHLPEITGDALTAADSIPVYDPSSRDYWANVRAVQDPRQSAEVLEGVAAYESEDDFLGAVASHPNASETALRIASKHTSFMVRNKVIENPNTTYDILRHMRTTAAVDVRAAQKRVAEGVNPMQDYYKWELEQAENLITAIDARTQTGDRNHA